MPSRSRAQHRYFEWLLHDPKARHKRNVSRKIAEEYVDADKEDKNWKKREKVKKKSLVKSLKDIISRY